MKIVTGEQMQQIDLMTQSTANVPSIILMETRPEEVYVRHRYGVFR